MDDTTSPSSASPSASDSDSYNTDSARLYFGPVKTPERNFVASNHSLFPPQAPPILRRSPRLSSPRHHTPETWFTANQDSEAQDIEEIDFVSELVNEVDVEDDEQMPYPILSTPQRQEEVEQDEPLSALADKILHAVDNPSPPPSPASALKMFDPYHPANVSDSDEYEGHMLFPNILQCTAAQRGSFLLSSRPETPPMNQPLIDFDSPPLQMPSVNHTSPLIAPQKPMSVDDLLADSTPLRQPLVPASLLDEATISDDVHGNLMTVDSPDELILEKHTLGTSHDNPPASVAFDLLPVGDANSAPLRRSSRPRKSVFRTPSPQPRSTLTPQPSIARTSVKRRESSRNPEEQTIDPGDGGGSPLPPVIRNRHRSPSKEPILFHREVGSLSPTSASVLSSLAFDSIGAPGQSNRSTSDHAVHSFSVFPPQGGTFDGLSTPVRTDGPRRVPNSLNIEISPRKFRLQSPAPNTPCITPARRIPIEQAIAEGRLSPDKAAKIGFKAGNSTPATVSTPARRVLMSEKHENSKLSKIYLESPIKQSTTLHPHRAIPLLTGNEEEGVGSSIIKPGSLPYPIVPSQDSELGKNLSKSESSPVKSTLKVVSKIPRINRKPYSRNVTESAATNKRVESSKSLSTSLAPRNLSKSEPIRLVETANKPLNAISRPKPSVSTSSVSSALLKRKREEITSPNKPRAIVLRQVPHLSTQPLQGSSNSSNDNERASSPVDRSMRDTIIIRRVVTRPEQPPPEPNEQAVVDDILPQSDPVEPSSSLGGNDIPPSSPMKQDPPEVQEVPANAPSETSPPVTVETPQPVPEVLGLRRTSRQRRPYTSFNRAESFNDKTASRKMTRRKAATPQFDNKFSGMSITALKELTMTNTEKNQHYVTAKLETEVVRKEGLRPESPVVKIRTIVQREQEEKEGQRTARAKRRAKRSGIDDGSTSDAGASSDVSYLSPAEQIEDLDLVTPTYDNDDGLKHRRGAGDDEDYQTPERPALEMRTRLFDDGPARSIPDRRVKWDRGLFTFAYLDEVELGSRQNLKENRTLKSILAPAAKALRLDTLGNLVHADVPLTDLVPENVTVKKFIYDNDVPAAKPPAPKITRSKAKRK